MGDENNNGIDDNVERAIYEGKNRRLNIDLRSALISSVLTLLIGGTLITVSISAFPDNWLVRAVAKGFAGGVCDPIKEELDHYKEAWSCIEGGAAIQGTDISVCAAKLGGE